MTDEPMTVQAADGRDLEVVTAGPSEGPVLLFHHGTPGAAVAFAPLVEAAAAQGMRTVLYSRPGYGGSTPHPGRRVMDAADDVVAVLDALGVDTFLTAGWSGGGPHALACAALLTGRCRGAAILAGVAPLVVPYEEWTAGMGTDNLDEFAAATRGSDALTAYLTDEASALRGVTGPDLLDAMATLISPTDVPALAGETGSYLAALMRHGLRPGIEGWRDDDLAFVAPWGFDLEEIDVPVDVWQGADDLMVPRRHGDLLVAALPTARPRFPKGHGHLTLMADPAPVLAALTGPAGSG